MSDEKNNQVLPVDTKSLSDALLQEKGENFDAKTILDAKIRILELESRDRIDQRKLDLEEQAQNDRRAELERNARLREKELELEQKRLYRQSELEDRRIDIEQKKNQQEQETREKEAKSQENKEKIRIIPAMSFFALVVILLLLFLNAIGAFNGLLKVSVPESASFYKDKQYADVASYFKKAGFANIQLNPKQDNVLDSFSKDGSVITVSINGNEKFKKNEYFTKDAAVIISYHQK